MTQDYENTDILEIENISITRGHKQLCANLSFALKSGDMLWIKGSNGIGKTSLLLCIAGLLRPQDGRVLWNGHDIHKAPSGHCAFQGHQDGHKGNLSVVENLEFWYDVFESSSDVSGAIKQVDLWDQRDLRAKNLSAGQSRRLALARLIIKNAPLWILDEPSAAMDTKGQSIINELLKEHISRGGCALLASHGAPNLIGTNTRLLTMEGKIDEHN